MKGEPYTVVGVLPEGATTPLNADLYTALQPTRDGEGGGTNFEAITRLRDGATWQEADAEINRAWTARASRYELDKNAGAQVTYYSGAATEGSDRDVAAAGSGPDDGCRIHPADCLRQPCRIDVGARDAADAGGGHAAGARCFALAGSTTVLDRESAAGAYRRTVGIGTGFLALRGLLLLLPENFLPVAHIGLDGRVMLFTLTISLLTSVLFGMLPSLVTRKVDLRCSMSTRAISGTGGQHVRQLLIAGQVALTVVLLAASGLLIHTLIHLETLPPGFNPNGVMTRESLARRCEISRHASLSVAAK